MNIALEQTEEYVGGQLKNKYGDAFIRGNNGECPMYAVAIVEMQSWGLRIQGVLGAPCLIYESWGLAPASATGFMFKHFLSLFFI